MPNALVATAVVLRSYTENRPDSRGARQGIEARVIAGGGQTTAEQQIADLLHVFAGGAVDDATFILALIQQLQQLHALGRRLFDSKIQIWTVKTGGLDERFVQTECLHNVVTHLSRCGCRKRGNERPLRQFKRESREF